MANKRGISLKLILVPLDDSQLANTVIPYIAFIAKRFRSRCVLYHVREQRPRWREGLVPPPVGGASAKTIEEYLNAVSRLLSEEGVKTEVLIQSNDPAKRILETANALNADLIAIATHGHSGVGQWLFGSVAHRVVERATRPLLLVRPPVPSTKPGTVEFNRLLVPVDGTEEGEAPLPLALEFAAAYGSTLHLLHVVPTLESLPTTRLTAAALSPAMAGEYLSAATAAAEDYLADLSGKLEGKGLTIQLDIRRGHPADEILKYVRQVGIDLTFMGTHGRVGLGGAWYGSVGNKVLSQFTTPLLLVRAPGRHEED